MVVLVLHLTGETVALPLESVQSIAPMAQLARPPGMPSPLEGFLNLAGTAVPVLRLDRLLRLPEQPPGLYSMLVILKCQIALLVDRASEILSVPAEALLPVAKEHSFNACAAGSVTLKGQVVHLLSPERILLEKERQTLADFQAMAQQRLGDWGLEAQ